MTDTTLAVTERSVATHGYRIHLREAGSGPLVLMLHGFPETSHAFRHQIRALAQSGYHAVAIDMLGGGRSSKPRTRDAYRITELVAMLVDLVEALGEKTAVVIGHDWGAPTAWTCAWTRPDVFTAVIGASVPFGGRHMLPWPGSTTSDVPPSEVRRRLAGPDALTYQDYFAKPGALDAEVDLNLREFFKGVLHGLSAAGGAPSTETVSSNQAALDFLRASAFIMQPGQTFMSGLTVPDELPSWIEQEDFEAIVEQYEYSGVDFLATRYGLSDIDWELLAPFEGKKLSVPALFITGDRDVCTHWCRETRVRMDELADQAFEPVVIKDAGHWVNQEKPEEFNALMLDFLKSVGADAVRSA